MHYELKQCVEHAYAYTMFHPLVVKIESKRAPPPHPPTPNTLPVPLLPLNHC
jgi:hypothetical protein